MCDVCALAHAARMVLERWKVRAHCRVVPKRQTDTTHHEHTDDIAYSGSLGKLDHRAELCMQQHATCCNTDGGRRVGSTTAYTRRNGGVSRTHEHNHIHTCISYISQCCACIFVCIPSGHRTKNPVVVVVVVGVIEVVVFAVVVVVVVVASEN